MKIAYQIQKGHLRVSEIHEIYYEVCGNINGEPYLFVHGGPGAGFSEDDKRFFDFKKHKVIFFDQRGASKSKPFGCIENNTTQDLVEDINKLLNHFSIQKINIFGGSWGTTLSLIFAIQNPEKVKSLLLRGVFLGNKDAIEYYLNGGVEIEFPKEWNRFKNRVSPATTLSIAEYYLNQMLYGTPENKEFYCYEWVFYELSIYKKGITDSEIDAILKQIPYRSLAIMEAHYLSNYCFLEENYILENSSVLDEISITIIHGRDDAICPIIYAEELHAKLKKSTLYIQNGGHSDSEPEIEKRILEVLNL
ncbi:prolyl aminopeptidase [Flavobacterium hibernum]|uniref:Proline iminopeptidase n=1 Tax=Flavobacterium hibernum TaxID=37752 RepID=A0ABX4C3A9_9FLAO|nr:prolyl aminopeptidase [Flavobacterium hibernum]OXA86669.1 prolyl aminopeptidase [Flavobacterium hibernum]STO18779.1 Proline iminopeptidase [Flavobacterium hibernum]